MQDSSIEHYISMVVSEDSFPSRHLPAQNLIETLEQGVKYVQS